MSAGVDNDLALGRKGVIKDAVLPHAKAVSAAAFQLLGAAGKRIGLKQDQSPRDPLQHGVGEPRQLPLGSTVDFDAPGQRNRPFRLMEVTNSFKGRVAPPRRDSMTATSRSSSVSSPEPRRSSKNFRLSFGVNPRTIVISPSTTCVTLGASTSLSIRSVTPTATRRARSNPIRASPALQSRIYRRSLTRCPRGSSGGS